MTAYKLFGDMPFDEIEKFEKEHNSVVLLTDESTIVFQPTYSVDKEKYSLDHSYIAVGVEQGEIQQYSLLSVEDAVRLRNWLDIFLEDKVIENKHEN